MLKQSLALIGLTLSLGANAAIYDLGNITRDTGTGLEWLDVTLTRGLSYNQVTAQMGPGDTLSEYRYATMAELDQLIINFGYIAINQPCANTALHCDTINGENETIQEMILTLGDTEDANLDDTLSAVDISASGAGWIFGILGTQNMTAGRQDVAVFTDGELVYRSNGAPVNNASDQIYTSFTSAGGDESSAGYGSFLVRIETVPVETVPIPAAAWLFGSALLGLGVIKRRKS